MPYDFRNRKGKRVTYNQPYDSDEEDFWSESSCPDKSGQKRPLGGTNDPTERTNKRRGRSLRRRSATSTSSAHQPEQTDASQFYPLEEGTVLEWMIERKAIPEGQEIGYVDQGTSLRVGSIERRGIRCTCCNVVMTASEFQAHATQGRHVSRPYSSILLGDGTGRSLTKVEEEAWVREIRSDLDGFSRINPERSSDGSDDACLICADGGRLFCCDNSKECSSTFHTDCMGLEEVPEGQWYCPYCVCKHCRECGDRSELLSCIQCSKKFHWDCYAGPLDLNRDQPSFCEESCEEIHEKIVDLVGVQNQVDEGYSWTVVRRWQKHHGGHVTDDHRICESHSKLAVARQLLKDCFLSVSDRLTQIDFIDNVVYSRGSNYTRINFSNFFSFVLEKNDQILAAACLRVHGLKLAEMPYIATHEEHRKMGIGKRLLDAIIEVLGSLNVSTLVIPSAEETRGHWKRRGFKEIDESTRKQLMDLNTLMFPEAHRLQLTLRLG